MKKIVTFIALIFLLGLWQCKSKSDNPDPQNDLVEYTFSIELIHEDPDNPGKFKTSKASEKFKIEETSALLNQIENNFRKISNDILFENLPGTIKPWDSNPESLSKGIIKLFKTRNGQPDPIEDLEIKVELPSYLYWLNKLSGEKFRNNFVLAPEIDKNETSIAKWNGELYFDIQDASALGPLLSNEELEGRAVLSYAADEEMFKVIMDYSLKPYIPKFQYTDISSNETFRTPTALSKSGDVGRIYAKHIIGTSPCPTYVGKLEIECLENDFDKYYFRIENGHPGLNIKMKGLNNTSQNLNGNFNANDALGYFSNGNKQEILVDFNCSFAANINHNYTIYVFRVDEKNNVHKVKEMTLNVLVDVI